MNNKHISFFQILRILYSVIFIFTSAASFSRTFIRYMHEPDNPNSLSDNDISSIAEELDGNLWIGTKNAGLNKLDTLTGDFQHFRLEDGLVNECIYGILIDDEQNVWFITNMGISRLNPILNRFKHYDVTDGLQSNEFNSYAYYKNRNGEMFFGGVHGLSSFLPEEIKDNQIIPPLVITSFKYGGRSIECNLKNIGKINLDWQQNFFEVEFSALNFIGSSKNQYAYKLEGFDDKWHYSGTRRYVSYTNIPGGNFTLRILGSNNDNVWNTEGLSIKIKVSSPPWRSWWAYLLYIIIPLMTIIIIIRTILEHQRHILFKQFTINIAHEIKTPLTLVTNHLDRYVKNHDYDNDLIKIYKNMNKIKKDIVNLFNTEAFRIGKIIYNHNQLLNITTSINDKLSLFEEAFSAKQITVKKEISKQNIYMKIDPLALDEILNNLLDNCVKYNKSPGSVAINLFANNSQVILSIEDEGIGISRKDLKHIFDPYYQVSQKKRNIQGVGLGLYITNKIVNEIQGKLKVESVIDRGTKFEITFPCKNIIIENFSDREVSLKNRVKRDTARDSHQEFESILLDVEYDDSKFSVFVVEDNREMLAYLQEELIPEYNVFYGFNGEDALNKINNVPKPDIIISDIMMDIMDGYEFYDRVNVNKKYHSIPFIFITAKTGIKNQITGLQKGAVDFIEKPFSMCVVKEKISSLIDIQISKEVDILENINKYKKKKILELFKKFHIIPSERRLIIYAIGGKKNREIADQLQIQYNSVKTYFFRIYKKCNVTNRVELINLFSY